VDFAPADGRVVDELATAGLTPVAVEARRASESLHAFVHPDRALYVFGPEDGSISRGVLRACHRFVRIPSDGPLNLAAAINVVLYDRTLKRDAGPLQRA
jgi:tRNA(Leu) C34 or U34 (ribose-2'-O)-methylase TrmL